MATLTSTSFPSRIGAFTAPKAVLTSDDILTINDSVNQVLMLVNLTAGAITATIAGEDATTADVPGIGTVDTSAGYDIEVGVNQCRVIALPSIAQYLVGEVHITGGTGLHAVFFSM